MGAEHRYAKLFTQGMRSKAGPGTKECQAFVKSIDASKRTLTAVVSTEAVDRDNEIILKEAFRESLPGFLKNPVVLAAHMHRLQDGRSPVVAVVKAARVVKEGLFAEIEFHNYTEIAEEYWQLYSNKVQRAFSIGFIALEHEYRNIEGKTILCHSKIELLEISCVAIPSNREALSRSAERKRAFVERKREDEKYGDGGELAAMLLDPDGKYEKQYPWLNIDNMWDSDRESWEEYEGRMGGGDDFTGLADSRGDDDRFARLF